MQLELVDGERLIVERTVSGVLGLASGVWGGRAGVRRSRLRQGYGGQAELAGQRPALPVVGARRDANLAKLKPIKVNQRVLRVSA